MSKAFVVDRKGKIISALREVYPNPLTIGQVCDAVVPGSEKVDYYRTTATLSRLCRDGRIDRLAPGVYQYIWTPQDGAYKRSRQWYQGRLTELRKFFKEAWPDEVHIQELPRNHDAYKADEMRRVSAACSRLIIDGTIERLSKGTYRFLKEENIQEQPDLDGLPLAYAGIAAFIRDMKKLGVDVKISVDVTV